MISYLLFPKKGIKNYKKKIISNRKFGKGDVCGEGR